MERRWRKVDVPDHYCCLCVVVLVDDPINGAFRKTYCPPSGLLLPLPPLPHWPLIEPYNPFDGDVGGGRRKWLLVLLRLMAEGVENIFRDFSFHYLDWQRQKTTTMGAAARGLGKCC